MALTFKTIENYTTGTTSGSGIASFVKNAKSSIGNSVGASELKNYVSSLPVTSMKIVNDIQISDSVKKTLENAQKGIVDLQNGLQTNTFQTALANLTYESNKQLEGLEIKSNELLSTVSLEERNSVLNEAINGIAEIKATTLGLTNEVINKNLLETEKIVNVALNKVQLQLLKDKGYTGTVLLSKMTLPEGEMYFKTEDLVKKPEMVKKLLADGVITQQELNSGGVKAKTIMKEYLEYMGTHQSEETMSPVLPQTTTIKTASVEEAKTLPKATGAVIKTTGQYDTSGLFGKQTTEFATTEKETGTFDPSEYYWATSGKEGLKVGKVLYDGYERTGVGERGTLIKGDILNTLESEGKIDSKNWVEVSEGTSLGEHYRLNEIGSNGELIAHSVSAQVYGGEAKQSTSTAIIITKTTEEGGVQTVKLPGDTPIKTLTEYKEKGFTGDAITKLDIVATVEKSTLSSTGTQLINTLLGLTGSKLVVNENLKANMLEIQKTTTPLSTNIEKEVISQNPTAGKWFWETWEVEGTPTVVSQLGNWIADRIMTPEYSAERAGLITIGEKSALNIGDILTLNDKSGKANIFAPILNIIEWTESSSITATEKGKTVNDLFADKLKSGESIGELVPGISEDTAKYAFLTTATPVQLAQVTQTIEGLHQINYMASDPTLGHATLAAFGPTIIETAKIQAPLTSKEAGNLQGKYLNSGIEAIVSPKMTGDPVIDIVASPFTVLNADVGVVAKAWKELGLVSRLDKGITGISKTAAITSTLFVPATETGWIAKATTTGIQEVLEGGKLVDWKPLSSVVDLSKSFEKAVDNPVNSKIFVNNLVAADKDIAKSVIAEKIALEPNTVTNVLETGIKLSDDMTAEKITSLWNNARTSYISTSMDFAKEIATKANGNTEVASKLLFDAGEKIGRTPVESMANVALQQGTEHFEVISNALEGLKKLDLENAIKIPTGLPTGASKAISGTEMELTLVMPEEVANRLMRYGGSSELRKIENIEDIAKLNADEIKFLAKDKGISVDDLQKYRNKAEEILKSTKMETTTIEDYTKVSAEYKKWDTETQRAMDNIGIKQIEKIENGKIELDYTFDTKKVNSMTDSKFESEIRLNKSEISIAMENMNLASIEKLDISTAKKTKLKENFWNELTATEDKQKVAILTLPSKDINELYDLRTALMDNQENMELIYAKQLKEEGSASVETLSNVKRAREAVNNVDALIEIKKGQAIQKTSEVKKAKPSEIIENAERTEKQVQLKPGKATQKEATLSAIEELKKGNIEDAAKKLAESNSYKKSEILKGRDAEKYADTSTQKIMRMIEHGAPEDLVKQMAKERSEYALKKLSEQSNDMKRIAFKISNGDELTELERIKLWKEQRDLGIDAMWHEMDQNGLVRGLKDDALKSGNEERIRNLAEEMKKTKDDCIKKGDCTKGGSKVAIAGAAIVGGAAIIGAAEGRSAFYDEKTDTYYTTSIKAVGHEQGIPGLAAQAWNELVTAGIPDRKYTFGNIPDVQGRDADQTEYICQNFAMDAANYLQSKGYNAWAVLVSGNYDDGTQVKHAIIAIEDKSNMSTFILDPTDGVALKGETTEEKNTRIGNAYKTLGNFTPIQTSGGKIEVSIGDMTLIEPQTGEMKKTGISIAGKEMTLGGNKYTIDAAVLLGGEISQREGGEDTHKTNVDIYSKSNMLLDTNISPEIETVKATIEETQEELKNAPEIETIKPD